MPVGGSDRKLRAKLTFVIGRPGSAGVTKTLPRASYYTTMRLTGAIAWAARLSHFPPLRATCDTRRV